MKALVTGGAGFIGSHLVNRLLEKGIEVVVYDNFSSGVLENLKSVESDVKIIHGDIRDLKTLISSMKGIDYVFHLAAIASISQSIIDPISTSEVNLTGTLNVLWSALKSDISRVILSSSCAVYGDINNPPIKECCLAAPKSPYAAAKLMSEAYAESFYHCYGLETVCLRYFNVYGPRQKPVSDYAAVIPLFIECYKNKKSPQVYGNGLQNRDFIHVYDVAESNIKAALTNKTSIKNRNYNIGTGKSINILQLLEILSKEAGFELKPEFKEARKGDIINSWSDCTLANKELNFSYSTSLESGIKDLLKF